MKALVQVLILTLILGVVAASAADNYFITVSGTSIGWQKSLSGYPGRAWGTMPDRVFLSGGEREIAWLTEYNIAFEAIPFDGDRAALYLCYPSSPIIIPADEIIYRHESYIISRYPLPEAAQSRRLSLRKLSFDDKPFSLYREALLTYDPRVAALIGQASTDTIIAYLSRLTGSAPIEINGGIDTIKTRYSGTADNRLAGQYLLELLQGYGYQTEYHGFYGGALRHVTASGSDRAWAVTEGSEALRTTDGGATWQTIPDNSSSELWGVEDVGPDSVWLSGNNGTIRFSSNGGTSFVTQSPGISGFLFGIDFINSSRGWIAADGGRVVRTTNSGQNWTPQTTSTSSRLYDVCFVDSLYGWAVGRDGAVVKTTNGGVNWTTQNANTIERLYGVDFIDRDNGWLVGWAGVVRRTTNGGTNWQTVSLGSNVEKYHVDFSDALHGCIVGWDGEVFMTSDGGDTWQPRSSGTTKDLYGVHFSDTLTGFAIGAGTIVKTTDGGQSWINQTGGVESGWRNVVATKRGTVDPGQQVIICGHMDNTSQSPQTVATGADDNGSGTIGVLEAARIFSGHDFAKTIKFCLWTGEEQGLLGSEAYAADAAGRGDTIIGVFNYDMIAWDGNNDGSIELHCGTMPSSQDIGHLFEDVLVDYQIPLVAEFLTWNSTDRSDHASFWDNNYPAILGIEDFSSDFNPYYHTTNDNMSIIDHDYFTSYVKAGVGAVATLAVPDTAMVGVDDGNTLPTGYMLHQNYPNPFNAATTISFTLPAAGDIELAVFDLLGRKVTTLQSGPTAAGTHSVTWNAHEYSSGIYMYRLITGDHSASGRMTLLK